jgi:hypothetical protein
MALEMAPGSNPVEQTILEDIRNKTGYSFLHIDGIVTRERHVAEAVLPVLREWVPVVSEDEYRGAMIQRFLTPHAHRYMDELIDWWQSERNPLNSTALTQIIASLAQPEDAERLWHLCRASPPKPLQYLLLAKLAKFPAVAREVKDTLVAALRNTRLTIGELQYISKVRDPRIRDWFELQLDSSNAYVSKLARNVVECWKTLPEAVAPAAIPPDRRAEIYSTEVELEEVPQLLQQLRKELGLKIPAGIRKPTFLEALEPDRWALISSVTVNSKPANLWFRMEDLDTVEIVLTSDEAGSAPVQ